LEKLIAIIDDVPEYGRRLAAYLNGSRTFPYRAVVFTDANEAESYIKNNGVYAVLATERSEKDILEVAVGTETKLFWFRETKELYRPFTVYRYDSVKEIERILTEKKETEKRIPVIGFFSPSGGYGAELLSRRVAEEFGKKGKILYISAYPFGIYGRDGEDGLSEALYFARKTAEEQGEHLRSLLQREDFVDSIGPVRWYTDLESMTKEDIEVLLQGKFRDTEYRAFFVAVGQFDRAGKTILNCCDRVLIPVWETEEGRRIQEEFRRQLKESDETALYSGILEFSVKEPFAENREEAVAEAVRKGGEVFAGD